MNDTTLRSGVNLIGISRVNFGLKEDRGRLHKEVCDFYRHCMIPMKDCVIWIVKIYIISKIKMVRWRVQLENHIILPSNKTKRY